MAKVTDLGDDSPFIPGSHSFVKQLEEILPSEKAQAVPYALIWEIDSVSGKAIHAKDGQPIAPLSMNLVAPPIFGSSVETNSGFEGEVERFKERPAVSLERIVITSKNPMGIISYREIDLSFTVHKPEVLFDNHISVCSKPGPDGKQVISSYAHKDAPGGRDSWSSFLYLGQCFALKYGWQNSSNIKNAAIGGSGDADNKLPQKSEIRFIVSNYNFQIQPDSQIKITIKGFEMGEFNLRRTFLIPTKKMVGGSTKDSYIHESGVADPYSNGGKGIDHLKKIMSAVESVSVKNSKKIRTVTFENLLKKIFEPAAASAYEELGFKFEGIFVSKFNARCGKTADSYCAGQSMSDVSILKFEFPLDVVQKMFSDLVDSGTQLTLYNFISPFINKMQDFSIWDRSDVKGEAEDQTNKLIPTMVMRSIIKEIPKPVDSEARMSVRFVIFDMKREYSEKIKDNKTSYPGAIKSKEELIEKITTAPINLPYVSLTKGNSYIQNTSFNVIQDEQMKSIFMRKALGGSDVTKGDKHTKPDASRKDGGTPVMQQIFSPTIQGDITMIGNFGFDVFNLIWIDFGVRQWSGFFNILEKVDTIEQGSFTTTVKVFSTGQDPFNTKSFVKYEKSATQIQDTENAVA